MQAQNSPTQSFLDRLEVALKKEGITRNELAKRLGVASSTITRWNHGAEPRAGLVAEIAQICGVRREWLAAGIEPMLAPEARTAVREESQDAPPQVNLEMFIESIPLLGRENAVELFSRMLDRVKVNPVLLDKNLHALRWLANYLTTGDPKKSGE